MYFKKTWQSMAENEPAFGHDIFQTSPNCPNSFCVFKAERFLVFPPFAGVET